MFLCVRFIVLAFAVNNVLFCEGQYQERNFRRYDDTTQDLPESKNYILGNPKDLPANILYERLGQNGIRTKKSNIRGVLKRVGVKYSHCLGKENSQKGLFSVTRAVPFPTCRADDLECLRRGLRTFFFLMDSGHLGMKPVDPVTINSVTVAVPEHQMSFLLRNLNVTGARWTKLVERRFDLANDKSGVIFNSDLHVMGDIIMMTADRIDPYVAKITMDIQGAETNITYSWRGQRGIDNYDYILLGPERIAVRNSRTPSFFLQPETEDAMIIDQTLHMKNSMVDHLSNEITASLMHSIVDNFRLFARMVPVHHFYKLYK